MMMEVTGKKTNLKELVEQATEHLVSLKYLPDSVKQYRRIWEKLKNYSQEKGAEYFSITLGHEFLEYQYGLIVGKETKKVDHVRSRAIRILSDYQQNGAIIKK